MGNITVDTHDIGWAVEQLKKGHAVKRWTWSVDNYYELCDSGDIWLVVKGKREIIAHLSSMTLLETDWIRVYREGEAVAELRNEIAELKAILDEERGSRVDTPTGYPKCRPYVCKRKPGEVPYIKTF